MVRFWRLAGLVLILTFLWSCGQKEGTEEVDYVGSRLLYLTAKLQLDQPQADRIRAILSEDTKAAASMRTSDAGDPREIWRGLRERQAKTDTLIASVLSDEQKETYRQLQALGINDNNFIELQAKLNLTVAQSDTIAKIFSGMRRGMGSMRGPGSQTAPPGDREGRMTEMRAMREKSDEAIRTVLDENQKKLYDKIQEERMEQMRQRFERNRGMWE
jgi:hypothetical protein